MKKAISLMLALVLALSMLGFPAFAEEVPTPAEAPAVEVLATEAAPAEAVSANAPKDDAKKVVLDEAATTIKQKDGTAVPESGFPLTKNNKLVVRVTIAGGGEKTVAKGRVSIGTDIKKPKKDLVKAANDKTKLSGSSEFSFTTKALKALKAGKEYKLFFQSSKTKNYPAVARMQIGTVKVISAKDAAKLQSAEQPDEAKPDEAAADGDIIEEAIAVEGEDGVVAKDLRRALTVLSMTTTPADGVISNLNSGMTVTVKITGGASKENVQANVLLLDASGAVALGQEKAYIAAKTEGSTTWTFTGPDLVKLKSGTYTIAIDAQGTLSYAPIEMHVTPIPKTVTINQARTDVPALGAMSLSKTSWDLVTDKDTDVVLTATATPELTSDVRATFQLMSADEKTALITVEGTLSKAMDSTITFPAANLLTVPAGGPYKIFVATAQSIDHNPKPAAASGCTLTVTGATRTAYAITGGSVDTSNFTEIVVGALNGVGGTKKMQYVLYSGEEIKLKDVTNDAPADITLPVRVTIGSSGFTYDTSLSGTTGDIVIPSKALVAGAAAGTLKTTVKDGTPAVPATGTTPAEPATPDEDFPISVTVQILPSATLKESAVKSVGTLSIAKNTDVTTTAAIQITNVAITNGNITGRPEAFARSRGETTMLPVAVKLTTNHATKADAKIDFNGSLNIGTETAPKSSTLAKPFLAQIPFSISQTVGSTSSGGTVDLKITIPASVLNALPENTEAKPVAVLLGIDIQGNDLVRATNFSNKAIGVISLNDLYLPTPVYDGTPKETWTWTKGGQKKTISNISFTDGVMDRTATAKVYALKSKLTTLGNAAPTGSVELGSGKVTIQGKTPSYTLTKKGLDKLAAGVYYLYILVEKDTYNKVSQIGSSTAAGIVDRGYIGKLTVKAASGGGGGGGGGGSSGGSSGGSTNNNTSTDGGTDTVAGATDKAADTTSASQIAFGTYQTLDAETLAWMLARQPLMGREFLKYLLNQKGSQKVAYPLAFVADMEDPIKIPIVGGGQYNLGMAVFTPAKEGDATGYTFTVEPKDYADMTNLKIHLGADFEDLARALTDVDFYKPGDFVPVSTLKLVQVDGEVAYQAAQAEQVNIDSAVTNRITEWMSQG